MKICRMNEYSYWTKFNMFNRIELGSLHNMCKNVCEVLQNWDNSSTRASSRVQLQRLPIHRVCSDGFMGER